MIIDILYTALKLLLFLKFEHYLG